MTPSTKHKRKLLHDVDVTHVSLVDRPANRTPFKFVKREDGTETKGDFPMNITLKNLFGTRGPLVTSVIAKSEAQARGAAVLLMDGDKAEISETDGMFVVRKSGTQPTDTEQLVHAGNAVGIAYTVDNLKKSLSLYDMEAATFGDAVKTEGFVPGLMIGMDALHTVIRNIAMDEDTKSPDDMKNKVSKALGEFGGYIETLISELPVQAFKFEKALMVVSPTEIGGMGAVPGEGFQSEVYDAVFGDVTKPAEAADGAADGDVEETLTTSPENAPVAADAPADDAVEDVKADAKPDNLEELPEGTSTPNADFEASLNAMMDALTKSIGGQISQVAKSVEGLATRVQAQEATQKKLAKAVGGSVVTAAEEDPANVVQLRNNDNGGGSDDGASMPLMDTAYSRK